MLQTSTSIERLELNTTFSLVSSSCLLQGFHSETQSLKRWVLQVCALAIDLDILEDGHESEIGERGVSSQFFRHSDNSL